MFQSLRSRDFRFIWFSTIFVAFAGQMQNIARGWLIYDMTRSPMDLTWVMLSFMLPSAVFSLIGGVIADRVNKKTTMVLSNLLNAIATAVLAYVIYLGEVTFWHFIYFGLFNGTVIALGMPARASIVPEIVGDENLLNATALQTGGHNVSRIMGPVLAGLLIAVFAIGETGPMYGTSMVMFLIAILYLLAMLFTMLLSYAGAPEARSDKTPMEDIREGLRFVRTERMIQGLLVVGVLPPMLGAGVNYLLPAFNQEILGGGPEDLGLLTTGMGLGALAGSILLARLGDPRRKGRLLAMGSYGWAVAIGIFAFSGNFYVAMIAGAMTAFASSFFQSLSTSLLQLSAPQAIRGRVMSVTMMVHAMIPIGVLPVSALAEVAGLEVALMASAGVLALAMFALNRLFPEVRHIDRGYQR